MSGEITSADVVVITRNGCRCWQRVGGHISAGPVGRCFLDAVDIEAWVIAGEGGGNVSPGVECDRCVGGDPAKINLLVKIVVDIVDGKEDSVGIVDAQDDVVFVGSTTEIDDVSFVARGAV